MLFYLGTHEPCWLGRLNVPLFVSHRRLARIKHHYPIARVPWALDSGGFTELAKYGGWRTSVNEYCNAVYRYGERIGKLSWAAPMDWMCEPKMLVETGLSVREHQERTVANYLEIRSRGPFIPVLQGWSIDDYEACVSLYESAGIDLKTLPLVGVGSVCKRQATGEIADLMRNLHGYGLSPHGFGVKTGLGSYGQFLTSADSMAWSLRARRSQPLSGCRHKNCANCSIYALRWREQLLAPRPAPYVWVDPQLAMFS